MRALQPRHNTRSVPGKPRVNGSEFADCAALERSLFGGQRTTDCYCHPYSPRERGSNENQSGFIRRRPKGTSFSLVTGSENAIADERINRHPREMFGSLCSADISAEHLADP